MASSILNSLKAPLETPPKRKPRGRENVRPRWPEDESPLPAPAPGMTLDWTASGSEPAALAPVPVAAAGAPLPPGAVPWQPPGGLTNVLQLPAGVNPQNLLIIASPSPDRPDGQVLHVYMIEPPAGQLPDVNVTVAHAPPPAAAAGAGPSGQNGEPGTEEDDDEVRLVKPSIAPVETQQDTATAPGEATGGVERAAAGKTGAQGQTSEVRSDGGEAQSEGGAEKEAAGPGAAEGGDPAAGGGELGIVLEKVSEWGDSVDVKQSEGQRQSDDRAPAGQESREEPADRRRQTREPAATASEERSETEQPAAQGAPGDTASIPPGPAKLTAGADAGEEIPRDTNSAESISTKTSTGSPPAES